MEPATRLTCFRVAVVTCQLILVLLLVQIIHCFPQGAMVYPYFDWSQLGLQPEVPIPEWAPAPEFTEVDVPNPSSFQPESTVGSQSLPENIRPNSHASHFRNISSFSSSSASRSFNSKRNSSRGIEIGENGEEIAKIVEAKEFSEEESADAVSLGEEFQLKKFMNATTDAEDKIAFRKGSHQNQGMKNQGKQISTLDLVQRGETKKLSNGSRRRRQLAVSDLKSKAKIVLYGVDGEPDEKSKKKSRPNREKQVKVVSKKKEASPPSQEQDDGEDEEESDPSNFTFRNDAAVSKAFGGGDSCNKERWEKCRLKCGSEKSPVYCLRCGHSIYKCHLDCMRGPCGVGDALTESKFSKPESAVEKEGKCTKTEAVA